MAFVYYADKITNMALIYKISIKWKTDINAIFWSVEGFCGVFIGKYNSIGTTKLEYKYLINTTS